MERLHVEDWKEKLTPVLHSKLSEFQLSGYADITLDDLWTCLLETVWKQEKNRRLYEVIQDVFSLSISTYMNYIQINALKSDDNDLMASIQAVTAHEENDE